MKSTSQDCDSSIRVLGCAVFGITAVLFLLLSIFLLSFGLGWSSGKRESPEIIMTVVAGWIYILGSIMCFWRLSSRPALIAAAVILNLIGSFVWLPFWASRTMDGAGLWILGLILTALWSLLVIRSLTKGTKVSIKEGSNFHGGDPEKE